MIRRILTAAALLVVLSPSGEASAQDVEMLGRVHGTRPPPAYFQRRATDPRAFRFSRAWSARIGAPLLTDAEGAAPAGPQGAPLGQRPGGVHGTLAFPLVLGLYADSPEDPPYSASEVQKQFFDGPNPTGTISEFYADQSAGLLSLVGKTYDWYRSTLTADSVAGGVSGLGSPGRVGAFILQVVAALDDGTLDWGQFDNDGPDGVANSGDDDGYVDVLAVMHPTEGAECTGSSTRVWSHRWSLRFAAGQTYTTRTPAASGGFIRIDDYTIQPVVSCGGGAINEIGVFAHELGHGLGLPDLYDTGGGSGTHGAAGRWDLMATGAWGCRGGNPARPCELSAWSKSVLGWIDVETLDPGLDYGMVTLPPTNAGARAAYRIDAGDGANEYFLLENRSQTGFSAETFAPGLLVWHIDEDVLANRWATNSVNADPDRMGVWLRAADGLDQAALPTDNRGDAGDPFPGTTGNTAFHAGSNPGSYSHQGGATGLTLLDISLVGDDVRFRALTRFQTLDVRAGGTDGNPATITVDGGPPTPTDLLVSSAPFQVRTIEAAAGNEISDGIRTGFQSWEDGSPRIRTFVTQLSDSILVAEYGGSREIRLSVAQESPVQGIAPGHLETLPPSVDGWFDEGEEVSVLAQARTGFAFKEWTGDLASSPNPVTVVMDAPLTATAVYEVTFGVGDASVAVDMEAAVPSQVLLEAENANLPVLWEVLSGDLPAGLSLSQAGLLAGAALVSGTFDLTVQATDAIGLEATGSVSLHVRPPDVGVQTLGAPFYQVGVGPTDLQREYLDRQGNANGRYDLGDFRAFVLANPELPDAAPPALAPVLTRVIVPLQFRREGGR